MSSPVERAAFSAVCWDDRPGGGGQPICTGLPAGWRTGPPIRLSASPAHPASSFGGSAVCAGALLGVAVFGFCGVRRGYSAGLYSRSFGGRAGMGRHCRQGLAARIYPNVEAFGCGVGTFHTSRKENNKNLYKNRKKTICNRAKMGYNKTESRAKEKGRCRRWKTERSAWFSAGAVWP